ncbi:glutamate permease [Methyloceanibacter methanicus]|uniref:Sodium/glutamate symporter n=1 Tax=Methyloceanibacter methanicus TaxID=1774968 RepID=A0A1E3W136_9HYPH|nr:sodium/glutamate symporter [Methyloceanibacter methanicus]ODR99517.1 glutamate permease [Methyloceanibacter methanicus]
MTHSIEINSFIALTVGFVVFFAGQYLTKKIRFLADYNIPEPVSGGIAVALTTWALYAFFGREISFDLSARDALLVYFFTTVGLNARFADLVRGGLPLALMLGATVVFMLLQNLAGAAVALLWGLPSQVGVLLGTASLIGGHGTAIAWGPRIAEARNVAGAAELGVAMATMGLIVASLLGGPIAKYLIEKNDLKSDPDQEAAFVIVDNDERTDHFDYVDVIRSLLVANIAIIAGYAAHVALQEAGVMLPLFVPCLLAGIVLTNTVPSLIPNLKWPSRSPALALVSDFSLSVFLAMSLMSMQMWTLSGSTGLLITTTLLQAALAALFILFVFYRLMGSNYFAAVLSAGFAGFTLGATPTAIANMSAVTKHFGPSPLAFIVLPLVSAFFVDLANAVVIQLFVGS